MPTPTQVLQADVESLKESLSTLHDKLDGLFVRKTPDRVLSESAPKQELSNRVIQELGESDPVPAQYREVVDKVLNSSFGIHIKYATSEGFQFTIVVPEKYSSFTPEQKAMNGVDLRLKVIEYALGVGGVQEWTDMVYKNFNLDVQALITADRSNKENIV